MFLKNHELPSVHSISTNQYTAPAPGMDVDFEEANGAQEEAPFEVPPIILFSMIHLSLIHGLDRTTGSRDSVVPSFMNDAKYYIHTIFHHSSIIQSSFNHS